MMPDDSQSIARAGNTDAVRDGHNFVLDALGASKQSGEVLAHTRYLNGHVLFPYTALEHAQRMTPANYDPRLGTPLYDQTAVVLGTVIAKSQELAQAGIAVRTVTLIITDGGDYGSTRCKAADVAAIVRDMLAQENHIVAAMGISDGTTDFQQRVPRDGHPRPLDPDARQQRERDPARVPGVLAIGGSRGGRCAARRVQQLARNSAGVVSVHRRNAR